MTTCATCGQENPAGFNFCGACGAAFEPAGAREERKVVTVLFTDLVGFTARAEQMDPEDVRRVLTPYHARVRSELERFGGTVEKFIGDAVAALFGAPVAHEDDPERAVRAALAIREWAEEEGIELRIGVNTGEVLITLGVEPLAAGDVVNTAARLQAAAPVTGILVGETTYRATMHAIEYDEAAPVAAKGKAEPIAVWQAVQARATHGVDLVRGVRTPLVGRTREVDALRAAFVRAREERTPQLVTLIGVPGIGKSRLVYELWQLVEADPDLIRWRQGRSLPYGEGVSFWPVAEIVKAEAGILENDSSTELETKLRRAVEEVVVEDADWVVGHLKRLVGQGEAVALTTERRAEAFAAWRRFFEGLSEEGPAVLVFEDLHWADEGTLDFVDHLVDWMPRVPLLVVGTGRPELLERRTAWGGGKTNALTMALSPLSDAETARLIAALADRPLLDATLQQQVLAHAEGNPLYAEQYVRMALERPDHSAPALPETVHGIIAARLDGLGLDEKTLLQSAAVLGKVFWAGAAAALDDVEATSAAELLHALARKEFVERARRSSVAGETEYAFRHVLVRDVAYAQIPRAQRAERHRRAAEWIERVGRPEDNAEMVAHHLTTALEHASAAGMDTTALVSDARHALRLAAERAAGLGSLPTAASLYERLLELTPADDPDRAQLLYRYTRARLDDYDIDDALLNETRASLLAAGDTATAAEAEAAFASIYWLRGDHDSCFASVAAAIELIAGEEASPAKAYVLAQVSRFEMLAGHSLSAIEIGREALELAERFGLAEASARALNNIGVSRVDVDDVGGLEDLERSLSIGEQANSTEAWQAASNMASMYRQLGDLENAERMRARAREINGRFGLPGLEHWAAAEDVEMLYQDGQWDEAHSKSSDWLLEMGPTGHYMEAPVRMYRSQLSFARADLDQALDEGELALQRARSIEDPQILQPALSWWGLLAVHTGRAADAAGVLDELRTTWGSEYTGYGNGMLTFAWVANALGREAEAATVFAAHADINRWANAAAHIVEGDFASAGDILDEIGTRPDAAYARLRAAGSLFETGRSAEADQQLARALSFYRSVGATRFIDECEALLAASA